MMTQKAKPIVALLDDDPANCQLIKWSLQELATVYAHHSFEPFFEFLDSTLPDAIILDLMMPEKNGLLVLEQLKSDFPAAYPRVILLSASPNGDLAKQIKSELGLETHARPYMRADFEKLVQDILSEHS
jgi:CheY-like chemotaxis protein